MQTGKYDHLRPHAVHVRKQPMRYQSPETLRIPKPVIMKKRPMEKITGFVRHHLGATLGGALLAGLLAGRFAGASSPQPAPAR